MSYLFLILERDQTLSWEYPATTNEVIADFNDIEPAANDFFVTLPAADQAGTGVSCVLNNVSGEFSFGLKDNAGNVLYTFAPGNIINIYLTDASTAGGSWRIIPFGGGSAGIVSLTVKSPDNSIVVTDGDVIPSSGNIKINLPTEIGNIIQITQPGYVCIDDAFNWTTRNIVPGLNIDVSDETGVNGNAVISTMPILNNIQSIQVGKINITGNTYLTEELNGNLAFFSNGTGTININNVIFGTDAYITTACVKTPLIENTGSINLNGVIIEQDSSIAASNLIIDKSLIAPSISTGNLVLSDDNIVGSKNIKFTSAADGHLNLNNVLIDSTGQTTVKQISIVEADIKTLTADFLSVSNTLKSPGIATGGCSFSDAFSNASGLTSKSNVIVNSKFGIVDSVIGSNNVFYTINFNIELPSNNYLVVANLVRPFAATQVQFQAYIAEKQTSYCIVYCMDINGNYLPAIDGLMILIYS